MSSRSVVTFTSGVSGSGKTYYRCACFLVEEWLPLHDGKLISNYPINIENLVRDFGEEVRDRIEIIPEEVLKDWREGRSGPWDYFYGRDVAGAHIAIDEIHNYCPKTAEAKLRKKWMQFVGEIRHMGATVEFLSQNEGKVAKELVAEAEIRYEIINGENFKFPLLGYRMGDLYEFRAKLLGKYLCPSYCREYTQAGGDWILKDSHTFYRMPKYFEYYNSFNAPSHGLADGARTELRPWEKYSWPMLFLWFYMQYYVRITFQLGCIALFVWFFFFGGLTGCVHGLVDHSFGVEPEPEKVKTESARKDPEKVPEEVVAPPFVQDHRPCWRVITPRRVVYRDWWVIEVGDDFYGVPVEYIDVRRREIVLADGFRVPVDALSAEEGWR